MKTLTPTAAELALVQLGYSPGAPAHVTRASQDIDAQLCRSLRCGRCGKKGLDYRPLHRGRQYAALAVYTCGEAEEV